MELRFSTVNRRKFLVGAAAAAASVAAALPKASVAAGQSQSTPAQKPNVIYHSDPFRWDFVGAKGLNSSTHTPNLDALAAHGTNFNHAVADQPVCAPLRSVLMTGRYATETGVRHNGFGLGEDLPTIATEFRKAVYTAN
jgi:arylsulfatase A-like enzyme